MSFYFGTSWRINWFRTKGTQDIWVGVMFTIVTYRSRPCPKFYTTSNRWAACHSWRKLPITELFRFSAKLNQIIHIFIALYFFFRWKRKKIEIFISTQLGGKSNLHTFIGCVFPIEDANVDVDVKFVPKIFDGLLSGCFSLKRKTKHFFFIWTFQFLAWCVKSYLFLVVFRLHCISKIIWLLHIWMELSEMILKFVYIAALCAHDPAARFTIDRMLCVL